MTRNRNSPYVAWFILAGVILAFALIALLAGCRPMGTNGDPVPQESHGTIVGPSPSGSARASIIPNPSPRPYVSPSDQAQADKLKKEHPTVLCNDGYLGWPLHQQGACSHHRGIAEWYGVQNT